MSFLKVHLFRGISPKWVLNPQKETSCHIFNMAIFSNFFVDINTHIIRCNAGEKMKSIFELFTKQNIGFRFVLFLRVQTLCMIHEIWSNACNAFPVKNCLYGRTSFMSTMAILVVEFSSLNIANWCNGEVPKSAKIWLSKSIFYIKNHLNLSDFFFIEEYEFRSTFFVIDIFW